MRVDCLLHVVKTLSYISSVRSKKRNIMDLGQKTEKFDVTFECENGYLKVVKIGKYTMTSLYFNGDREYSEHYLKALFVLKRLYEYGDENIKQLMKETHIDPAINWFSNSPGPYSGYPHKPEYNKRIYPVTVYDLCQEFQKIRDFENRFCWDNFDKNSYVFYYCWKE